MNVRVQLVCLGSDGSEQRQKIMDLERTELAMETLGMSLTEGKSLLERVQGFVVGHQVNEYLE